MSLAVPGEYLGGEQQTCGTREMFCSEASRRCAVINDWLVRSREDIKKNGAAIVLTSANR